MGSINKYVCPHCKYESDEIFDGVGMCQDDVEVEPICPPMSIEEQIEILDPNDDDQRHELSSIRTLVDKRFFEAGICPNCKWEIQPEVIHVGMWD